MGNSRCHLRKGHREVNGVDKLTGDYETKCILSICFLHDFCLFREVKMCFDIGIVTCGPNEALVVSGMGYGEIDPDTKEYRPFVVMGRHFHN